MSSAFEALLAAMRDQSPIGAAASPLLAPFKELRGSEAGAFVREHRAHLIARGPIGKAHGAAADVGAFTVSAAIVAHSDVDAAFLLEKLHWPSQASWDAAMLARAEQGALDTAQIVAALASPGFAAGASALLPFGGDEWAVAVREIVAGWSAKARGGWTALVTLARAEELPLRPTDAWKRKTAGLARSLDPRVSDLVPALERFSLPSGAVRDERARSGLTRAAEENAKLLHAIVLFLKRIDPEASRPALARIAEIGAQRIEGLGTYLPKLAFRAVDPAQ